MKGLGPKLKQVGWIPGTLTLSPCVTTGKLGNLAKHSFPYLLKWHQGHLCHRTAVSMTRTSPQVNFLSPRSKPPVSPDSQVKELPPVPCWSQSSYAGLGGRGWDQCGARVVHARCPEHCRRGALHAHGSDSEGLLQLPAWATPWSQEKEEAHRPLPKSVIHQRGSALDPAFPFMPRPCQHRSRATIPLSHS